MLWSLVVRRWPRGNIGFVRCMSTNTTQRDEPLRILFCGTEAFSITALEALHKYGQSSDSNILSIDVATRNDKAGGRGMKELRSPQIKRAAARLGLPVHQFDTFTGWHLPEYGASPHPYINLVVAVSFGLLVPPRILKNAKFGGLNVHPSMLPDLRGAAPINWTIMRGHTHTGVSVQTLHPSKFDHGLILAQTPSPGLAIPNPNSITAHELRLLLAPVGADMLVDAIRNKLYIQPYNELRSYSASEKAAEGTLAPKIIPSMKMLDPSKNTLTQILRRNRAIPKLWAEASFKIDSGEQTRRIIFGPDLRAANMRDLPHEGSSAMVSKVPIGVPFALLSPNEDVYQSKRPLYLKVKDEAILQVPRLLVAGGREGPAAAASAHAKLFDEPIFDASFTLYQFQQPLYTSKPVI